MGKSRTSAVGEVNYNNFGSKMIIKEDRGYEDIDVLFPEYNWIYKNTSRESFRDGSLSCPYEPRVYNVGYNGEGKYKIRINGKVCRCYHIWQSMMQRCYSEECQEKKPTYKGCSVCIEWHNYQVFAEWYYNNIYQVNNERMHLDKDILIKGNKIYSPDTCVFVPYRINLLFTKSNKVRGKYPIGVCYSKNERKLKVSCSYFDRETNKTKMKHLAYYPPDQVDEAFLCYKQFKETYIKQVADEYKELIPDKLYQALINYEVEIDD